MDTLKDFGIATVFILVCAVGLLLFAIQYPALNGNTSILLSDPSFNQTAHNLSVSLGNYQEQTNIEINVSTADEPTIDAQSLQLVSTVSTSRTTLSRLTASFNLLITLISNTLGLSSTQFIFLSGTLISLFGFVLLYLVVKMVRYGT